MGGDAPVLPEGPRHLAVIDGARQVVPADGRVSVPSQASTRSFWRASRSWGKTPMRLQRRRSGRDDVESREDPWPRVPEARYPPAMDGATGPTGRVTISGESNGTWPTGWARSARPSKNLHGHRYVAGDASAETTTELGMVLDFGDAIRAMKGFVDDRLDHACIVDGRIRSPLLPRRAGDKHCRVDFPTTVENLCGCSRCASRRRSTSSRGRPIGWSSRRSGSSRPRTATRTGRGCLERIETGRG